MGVMDRDVQVQHVGCRKKGTCRLTMQSSGQNCKCWYGAEWGAAKTINTFCHASYKQCASLQHTMQAVNRPKCGFANPEWTHSHR
jgi:hypothetical protein